MPILSNEYCYWIIFDKGNINEVASINPNSFRKVFYMRKFSQVLPGFVICGNNFYKYIVDSTKGNIPKITINNIAKYYSG